MLSLRRRSDLQMLGVLVSGGGITPGLCVYTPEGMRTWRRRGRVSTPVGVGDLAGLILWILLILPWRDGIQV